MHLPNEVLSPTIALTCYIASGTAITYASIKAKNSLDDQQIPLMGVMSAFVFAAQMVNFPILPGTSGHLCGSVLLAILLGPHLALLCMTSILTVQCLLFQDGGLLALGANILNMGVLPCYLGYHLYKKLLGTKPNSYKKLFYATFLSTATSVFAASLLIPFEIHLSQTTTFPLPLFLLTMGGVHILIAIVEALITYSILQFLASTNPQLLPQIPLPNQTTKLQTSTILTTLALFTLLSATTLSLLASQLPDGLEWSLQQTKISTKLTKLHQTTHQIQQNLALFPQYSHPKSSWKYWTSIAGITGTLATSLLALLTSLLARKRKNSPPTTQPPHPKQN